MGRAAVPAPHRLHRRRARARLLPSGPPGAPARGPADPEGYLNRLAVDAAAHQAAARGGLGVVNTRVVYDPVSVRDGVVRFVDRTAALLVLGTHRRTRPLRAVLGSHAARIVHDIEVAALVVPLDSGA